MLFYGKDASKQTGESKFYGIYRAISDAYIDEEKFEFEEQGKSEYPFRIKLEKAYDFKEPINEYDLINDPNIKNDIWTIIGKKVRAKGKGRASTPITDEIISIFIKKFIDLNENWRFIEYSGENIEVSNKIEFRLTKKEITEKFIENYNIEAIQLLDNDERKVRFELVLYGLFNQYINNELNGNNETDILEKLGIKGKCIKWYANYLPYGIEGTEIDFMISISEDGENTSEIKVIEFQRKEIDKDHLKRVCKYTNWVNKVLCKDSNIASAVLIGYDGKMKVKAEEIKEMKRIYNIKKMDVFSYFVEDEKLELKKIRIEE